MGSSELQVVVNQLRVTASQWRELSTELSVVAPPSPGQPFQPTTAAAVSACAATGVAAAALTARTAATASAVEAGAAGYVNNEATAGAAMASVRLRVV